MDLNPKQSNENKKEANRDATASRELDKWKNIKLNIGLIGENDQIKDYLIDKLTGVKVNSQSTASSRPFANNFNVQIWNIRREEDFDSVDVDKYDVFLLIRSGSFTATDYKLADMIESRGKKCLLVDVADKRSIEPTDKWVILVQSNDDDDIGRLNLEICKALELESPEKGTAYALTIKPISKDVIEKKTEILRSRAQEIALMSTLFGNMFAMPRFMIIVDFLKLSWEIWFYREQLGLTQKSFENLFKINNTFIRQKLANVISKSKYASYLLVSDLNSLTSVLLKTLPSLVITDTVDIIKFLPIMGSLLHGSVSYASAKLALLNILDEFSKISQDIQSVLANQKSVQTAAANSLSNQTNTDKNV